MKEVEPKTFKNQELLSNPEVHLPGEGALVVGFLRHSSFDKQKHPQLIDTSTGAILGDAPVHMGETKSDGYYGPADEKAVDRALHIPGMSTEEGLRKTYQVGESFANKLLEDQVPTYVKIISSPTQWINEEYVTSNIPHKFGNRTMSTAAAFRDGLLSVADSNDGLAVDYELSTDERLREAGYNFTEEADEPPFDSLLRLAHEQAEKEGFEGDAKTYFIKNHPLIKAESERLETRSSEMIAEDLEDMIEEFHKSPDVQELTKNGVRVVLVGATHSLVMKSFVMHGSKNEETAMQKNGYLDSEVTLVERTEDDEHNAHYPVIGYASLND